MNLSWMEYAVPVMMVIYWGLTEAIMWNAPSPRRKWRVRGALVMMYSMLFFVMWHGTDGLIPTAPRAPTGPQIVLSCWVASPKDEVTIDFAGMVPASKITARLKDASAPFAMECQYQFEIPKLLGWQYTEEGNRGIQ